jgi:hypothetical protein
MSKILILLVLFFSSTSLFAQNNNTERIVNPYAKYQYSTFEREFNSKNSAIKNYCDTIRDCRNFLTSSFQRDSTYSIQLRLFEKVGEKIIEQYYYFSGAYRIDEKGYIVLLGVHPFKENRFKIKEEENSLRRYKFKFNDTFSWTYPKKLRAYCDGSCYIDQ